MNASLTAPTWGLLLVNLGTPDSTDVADVRRYLRQFLMDGRVLDVPPLVRWLIVHLAILPRRPAESAHAYAKIWTERGSPLKFHTEDLLARVRQKIGAGVHVEYAMRYQNPSVDSAMEKFRVAGVDRIVVFPLYPQYAASSTGSTADAIADFLKSRWNTPSVHFVPAFYDHPAFIAAFAQNIAAARADAPYDHLLMSFHGLPERHVIKSDETCGSHCLKSENCCSAIVAANRNCYRAQCYATARALAAALQLSESEYTVSFQSRLGRDPWIKPYTDEVVPKLAAAGVRRLLVACPAFVADCLETIEEIGMRLREDFVAAGGTDFALVPSLNSSEIWADAVVQLAVDAGIPEECMR